MNNLSCPHCRSSQIKLNGHTHYRKQNHQCLACGRQFVADSQLVSAQTKELSKDSYWNDSHCPASAAPQA